MFEDKELQLRSEEVQDILTRVPHWMIRWGSFIIFFIILLVLVFSWFIRYPDIISASIIITTQNPPEKIIAKSTGKIKSILVNDRDDINENTPLAIIENPADYKDVYLLKGIVDSLNLDSFSFSIEKISNLKLGTIENAYAVFEKDYLSYELNRRLNPYLIDKQAQKVETNELQERLQLLIKQKQIAEKELKISINEIERYKRLLEKGAIAAQELENKNIEYLQYEKNINSLISQISSIYSSLNNLGKDKQTTQISETREELTLKRNAILSLNQLKKAISDWELTYVLKSSIRGKVSFLQIWTESQNINTGENVFVIIPQESKNILGKLKAPLLNSGKIKEGQIVNIRLTNYPDREFGIIKGKVKSISLVPNNDNNLLIDVELPLGLETSYKKEIIFQPEMSGTADIITDDLRLIERLLYQFRDIFSREVEIKHKN